MKWTPKHHHKLLTVAAYIMILIVVLSVSQTAAAQDDQLVYDYVFLIDTSTSMNDGDPPLFPQVINVANDFIDQLPDGANLTIITFDSTVKELGSWHNLTPSDRSEIIQTLSNLKATGSLTAMWDAVCAGVTVMEAMNESAGTHMQLMISYTDGLDNASQNSPDACLERYLFLQKNGYTYWIYNSLDGIAVPSALDDLEGLLGINRSDNPTPIRVAQFQPVILNMGNMLTEVAAPKQGCVVFWLSDPTIAGMSVQFNEPPTSQRDLPLGTGAQICASGTTCMREVTVSTDRVCFDFDLVNINEGNLRQEDFGEYLVSLPLRIQANDNSGQVYIMPNNLNIRFSLDEKMPTATATSTTTPTNTPEPTDTATPTPTSTPAMGTTNIRCQGKSKIDLGKLDINDDGTVTARQDCQVVVDSEYTPMAMLVNVESNDEEILPHLSLQAGNISGKSVQVPSETGLVSVLLNMPADVVKELKGGTHRFNANLVFMSEDTALVGDFKSGETNLPIEFQVVKPKSKLPWIITGGVVFLIAAFVIIKNIARKRTPPVFNMIMRWTDQSGMRRESLIMHITPERIETDKYRISVGSSPTAGLVVSGLPEEAFDIIGIRSQEDIEYYIEPKTPMTLNGVHREVQFKLMAGEILTIGNTTIDFIIGL